MRTILEEPLFRNQLQQLGVSSERLDELLESIILAVASHPEVFPEVPGKDLRRIVVRPFPGLKHMNIWFTYDDTTVRFLEIDVID